jgi:hypothetical protein
MAFEIPIPDLSNFQKEFVYAGPARSGFVVDNEAVHLATSTRLFDSCCGGGWASAIVRLPR